MTVSDASRGHKGAWVAGAIAISIVGVWLGVPTFNKRRADNFVEMFARMTLARVASLLCSAIFLAALFSFSILGSAATQSATDPARQSVLPDRESPFWRESADVAIGDLALKVPKPYLRFQVPDGRATLVSMWALLPGFEAVSPENWDRFDDNSAESRVVAFALRYAAKYRYPTPADQLNDFIKRRLLLATPEAGRFGLKLYHHGTARGADLNSKHYFGRYGRDQTVLLQCTKPSVLPSPSCVARKYLGGGVYLEYHFKTTQLQHWQEIDEKVHLLIDSFKKRRG
jgi:hypothetical protein